MFIPISDSPNPPGRPLVTWALIGLNVIIYGLITLPATMRTVDLRDPLLFEYLHSLGVQGRVTVQQVQQHISQYDLLVFRYGFRPAEFSLLSLVTSLFLHGGFLHVAGNMLFLYIFGDNVEYRLGRVRYLLTYLACGILATLFFSLFAAKSQVPLIGASGAIFGVLGCYFLWFPKNRVRCFLFLFPFITTNIYLSARMILGFFLVIDNVLPFIFTGNAASGIAHGAHIGGFLGGLAVAWAGDNLSRKTPRDHKEAVTWATATDPPPQSPELEQLQRQATDYLGLVSRAERQGIASLEVLRIGTFLFENGYLEQALRVFKRFIAERQNDPLIDQAYLGAGKALYRMPRQRTIAYQYFLNAFDVARSDAVAEEARSFLRRIENHQD